MGDLANLVPYAANFPADDPFTIECNWDGHPGSVGLSAFDDQEIYAKLIEVCTIIYKSEYVLQISGEFNFVVSIIPETESLTFILNRATVFSPSYKSLNPNFIVKDPDFALYAISEILEGMAKTTTFGSGWKTLRRNFPALHIKGDYAIIFDPSVQ